MAGVKSFKPEQDEAKDYGNNIGIRFFKKIFPVTENMLTGKFIERLPNPNFDAEAKSGSKANAKKTILYITPLFLALVTIELSDVIFAVDSIPAIFAISQDPIILYTSNIFAILGLRSLFFLLSSVIQYFSRLKQGIACILVFIGIKMLIADFLHISSLVSLIVIFTVVLISILISIVENKRKQ